MRFYLALTVICTALSFDSTARAAASAPAFYGDPPDEHHPWAVHDGNRPQPKVVTPGTFSTDTQPGQPPSDAVVLFNGTDLSNWESAKDGSPARWLAKDGVMEVVPKTGEIRTKEQFGDCQLHIEWAEPKDIQGTSQGRGNSGVFLMGLCEIQVLDSYHNVTYADGYLAPEATLAKRKQIAADIRQDAAHLADPANPVPPMLRLLESLTYESDEATDRGPHQSPALGQEELTGAPPALGNLL